MRKAMTKVVIPILASLLVAVFIFFLTREATSESGFTSVSKGMTEIQVRGLLGAPDEMNRGPNKLTYFYGGFPRFRWCTVEIYFDARGQVVSKFHDH